MKKDLYSLLGVAKKAKAKEIEKAYMKLARRHHPDVNPGDRSAARRFREFREAYRVLSNAQARQLYDAKGQIAPARKDDGAAGNRGSAGSKGWENIVKDVFQDGADGARETAEGRGADIHQVLEISFLESLKGAQRDITYQRDVECRHCRGRGYEPDGGVGPCPDCEGGGLVDVHRGPYLVKKICSRCKGVGQIGSRPCASCKGKGRALARERRKISVPAGSDSGTRVVFDGAGQPGKKGAAAGALVVTLRVMPHSNIERRGYNLYTAVPITVVEAALGATILVPTAERKVSLKIPAGTQPGQQFRIRNKGVPLPGESKRGDLYIEVRVVVPAAVDFRAKRLLRDLEKVFPENPRVRA